MMKLSAVILAGLLTLVSTHASFAQTAQSEPELSIDALLTKLKVKRDTVRSWAPLCADGTQSHGICPFGDMNIFSGLMCLSGEKERCNDVKHSQGPDGRWWRSPKVVGDDTQENSFSRDQALGTLAYLVATKDVEAAKRWQDYLNAHHQRMCTHASNNRCVITPGTSQLFGAVWAYLGLPVQRWMNRGEWYAGIYEPIEAQLQPADFPMHLSASHAYIRREIERRGGPKDARENKRVIKVLARREPKNPYFLMLRDGPTAEVAKLILEKCPDQRPTAERLDWAWQRSQDDKPWLHASGHECVFIVNLFEHELSLSRAVN